MYLLNEGTIAVGVMTAALAFAFLLVVALGAYVVYCDSQNRVGETEFAGIGHAEDPPVIPVDSTAGASDAPVAAAATTEAPAEHHARSSRRRARPPRES